MPVLFTADEDGDVDARGASGKRASRRAPSGMREAHYYIVQPGSQLSCGLPPDGESPSIRVSTVLRAAAGGAAVGALVARAAAHHDRSAGRARRRIFLVLDRRERCSLPGGTGGFGGSRLDFQRQLLRRGRDLLAVVHAGAELR